MNHLAALLAGGLVRDPLAKAREGGADQAQEMPAAAYRLLLKGSTEKRYTLGVAYPANRADIAVGMDSHRDFVGASALEEAAWSFLRKGATIGLHHQDGTEGHGVVVESYLWPGDDWPQPNGYVVRKGDWLVACVWDEPTWALIKSGKITGFSPQGKAARRRPSPAAVAALRH
jgi:hypothetical protein